MGHGRTGVGNSRERRDDDGKRGATNRVESATTGHLVFRFDPPPGGTDLEGIPGAGDSGGPAMFILPDGPSAAGVSSAGQPGVDGPGSYGATDCFTRVSTHLAWLDRVLSGQVEPTGQVASPAGTEVTVTTPPGAADDRSPDIPDSPAGRRIKALAALMLSDAPDIGAFIDCEVRLGPGDHSGRADRAVPGHSRPAPGWAGRGGAARPAPGCGHADPDAVRRSDPRRPGGIRR